MRRMGEGLKICKNKCWKNNKVHTYVKIGHRFPCFFVLFHSTKPYNIDPARQQSRDWGSLLNFSESGQGEAQLIFMSFATTRLHVICNGSNNEMEDGGGGGAHTPAPQPLDWG